MKLTVFTPCYNRAYCLPELYRSLCRQTAKDFEWLIIDDGSDDETSDLAEGFIGDGNITVRYIKKANGGKHTAYNLALENAMGDFFFCVDSDDILMDDAVEKIFAAIEDIDGEIGIIAEKCDKDFKILSDGLKCDMGQVGINELSEKYGVRGEFSLIFKSDIAKKYPFPIFDGEKFMGEAVVYDRIDKVGKYLVLPYPLTVCEYRTDGYTASYNNLMKSNPKGFCLYFMQRIDISDRLKARLSYAGKYHAFRIFSGNALKYSGEHKILVGLSALLGVVFWLYYKIFCRF